jgi:hypothetical protein
MPAGQSDGDEPWRGPGAHLALGATQVGLSASQVDAVPILPR